MANTAAMVALRLATQAAGAGGAGERPEESDPQLPRCPPREGTGVDGPIIANEGKELKRGTRQLRQLRQGEQCRSMKVVVQEQADANRGRGEGKGERAQPPGKLLMPENPPATAQAFF